MKRKKPLLPRLPIAVLVQMAARQAGVRRDKRAEP